MARLLRPAFGLPLEQIPEWNRSPWSNKQERFPHAIADFFAIASVTCREQRMLDFVNQITDKSRWWEKVYNQEILARWRSEVCGSEEQQRTSADHLDIKCFDFCVQELRDKATYLEKHNLVHVIDVDATVVKSDVDPSDTTWSSLRAAVRPLEDVPDQQHDWHPGSDGLVRDLLHPSLFPLQYGKSRVMPTGTVPLDGCAEYTGAGEVCPEQPRDNRETAFTKEVAWGNRTELKPWGRYQWLPSEVSFTGGATKIDSYINNLHPQAHGNVYNVLEQAVNRAVPLWNECLSWFYDRKRIQVAGCSYEDFITPTYPGYPNGETTDDGDGHNAGSPRDKERHWHSWLRDHPNERLLLQPSPNEDYVPFEQRIEKDGVRRIDLRSDFPNGLQVIFKLANIHLTPDKPTYIGSNWHVEGALNEHICATALFYYDSDNITDSYLEFRQYVETEEISGRQVQDEYEAAEQMYGIKNEEAAIQNLGRVRTRPGRWLAFPNVMQHRVGQFGLRDPRSPGHRKILAMFLVDPHIKILSTANVPPQQRDWWAVEVRKISPFAELPIELFERIVEVVDDFPISWDEACETREALMVERGRATDQYNHLLEQVTFYFCEH
ncbi:hypothetical protein LTR82_017630 [Friedmanniomyces endolithicus]|uniref:Uncharacterized protein n=1 Tax=Friedmanniomyces endolithicus TaxID=329885 RepID=A0AAN6J452_9PEZI|nr:hypothetical protein LTR82_017630 [Friedmanniomyces endolithicus]